MLLSSVSIQEIEDMLGLKRSSFGPDADCIGNRIDDGRRHCPNAEFAGAPRAKRVALIEIFERIDSQRLRDVRHRWQGIGVEVRGQILALLHGSVFAECEPKALNRATLDLAEI